MNSGVSAIRSVAEMMWPPPSTVVMPAGTVSDVVTSPQSAVNVNVVPVVVPAHTRVMSPPGMGAALATPPPVVKEPGRASAVIVIATTARPSRNRDIPTPRYGPPPRPGWHGLSGRYHSSKP